MENDIEGNSNIKTASNYRVTSPFEAVKLYRSLDESVGNRKYQTITEYFHEACEKNKSRKALAYQYEDTQDMNKWTFITYEQYAENVKQCSLILLKLGVQERTPVAIMAANCPEWLYMEFGAIGIGAITVGLYATSSQDAVYHMLNLTESSVCLVDTLEQWLKVKAIRGRLPNLRYVIQLREPFDLDELNSQKDNFYNKWNDLMRSSYQIGEMESELRARQREMYVNECAFYVFTSGSEGHPKAVMLSHDSILFSIKSLIEMCDKIKGNSRLKHISYLPLCHIAAQELDVFHSLEYGSCLYMANSQAINGSILDYLSFIKPNVFFGVPRIFEKLQLRALQYLSNLNGINFYLMEKSRKCCLDYHLSKGLARRSCSILKYWCAKMYLGRLKTALGVNDCRYLFVGGAPTSSELKRFFLSLDLPLTDCYGLSETSGVVIGDFKCTNTKAIGQPIKGIELKIHGKDHKQVGEIFIRGPCICMGYLNEPEKTMQSIDSENWLHTGDSGYLDDQGNVILHGRIKEIIITSGGENIPLVRIEMLIKQELPCLSNAVLIGDQRKYLTALITFKTEMDEDSGLPTDYLQNECKIWLQSIGLNYERISDLWRLAASSDMNDHKKYQMIINELEMGLIRVNNQALSRAQRVQYFTVLPNDFSLGGGELGSVLKMMRSVVSEKYATIIDDMYREGFQNKFAVTSSA